MIILLLLFSTILYDTLNFLKDIINKKPIANSIPANPKEKKVLAIRFMSSKYNPKITEYEYIIIQVISENRNINKKFE